MFCSVYKKKNNGLYHSQFSMQFSYNVCKLRFRHTSFKTTCDKHKNLCVRGKMIMGKVNMLISELNCKQPSSHCVIIKQVLCAFKNMSETSKQPRMKPGRGN